MQKTNNLGIALVMQNQAQKEVTVNMAIQAMDAMLNRGAERINENIPPDNPLEGEIYIIGNAPEGMWDGHIAEIAWYSGIWNFIKPNEGMMLWVNDEDLLYVYNGDDWEVYAGNAPVNDSMELLGVNAEADGTNRLFVKSGAVLFDNENDDIQLKLNKQSDNNKASILFQSNYRGVAEIGVVNDNNFQFKISPDGQNFMQSFVLDNRNGSMHFKKSYTEAIIYHANFGDLVSINPSDGNMHIVELTGNCVVQLQNPSNSEANIIKIMLKQDVVGQRMVTWSSVSGNNIKWPGGVAPIITLRSYAVDILEFITTDSGNNWYGMLKASNF